MRPRDKELLFSVCHVGSVWRLPRLLHGEFRRENGRAADIEIPTLLTQSGQTAVHEWVAEKTFSLLC
jgi:hypothetical protein